MVGALGNIEAQQRGGREELDLLEEGARTQELLEAHILGQGGEIEVTREGRVGQDGLDLRGEEETAGPVSVVEGIEAEAVVAEEEQAAGTIPEGEEEGAAQGADERFALGLVKAQYELRIASIARRVSGLLQLATQGVGVVELAAEAKDELPILTGTGLPLAVKDADGQAAEGNASIRVGGGLDDIP